MNEKRFFGRTAIVTGGNSGIGKATAIRFARDGAIVAIMARDKATGDATVEEIRAFGGQASFHKADITNASEVESAMNDILGRYERVDMAFNNAGYSGGVNSFDELTADEFDKVVQTNLYGIYHCMKRQIRHFLDKGVKAAIVNCASASGLVGFPFQSAYCASKHAVVGLTKSVALEYASQGIRINAICPGGVVTPMFKDYLRQLHNKKADSLTPPPIGRAASPEEIANIVTWLCSDEASYVVGQAYAVDGGYTTG
jgi:NAD(P)-dependent dehydrogenase (short-subunit alcohol dehydrogenase family)